MTGPKPTPDPGHAKCPRCLFPERVCLCAQIPTVLTRTRIIIIRHHLEGHRSSNTARLVALALPNCEIIEHGARSGVAVLPPLVAPRLLFPQGEPTLIRPEPPPRELVVLDATWSQARRMYIKLGALRGMPTLHLPVRPMPAARLRASPGPGRVSTIEAIAGALRLLEGEAPAIALERLFAVAVTSAQRTGRLAPQDHWPF